MIRWTGLAPWEFEFPLDVVLVMDLIDAMRWTAFEQRGNNLKGSEDFNLNAKARNWP